MRRSLLLVALAAACGEVRETRSIEWGSGSRRLVLRMAGGAARVRTGASGRVEVTARGRADLSARGDAVLVEAGDADLEIVAPPGIALAAVCREAPVEIEGAWSRLDVSTTRGAITARVERVESGSLESETGRIDLSAAASGPSGDFAARSLAGDVAIRMPASWRGRLHLSTQEGRLDVPDQKGLRATWDEASRSVLAYAGPALSEAERAAEIEARGSPAALWASSASGTVSFRLGG